MAFVGHAPPAQADCIDAAAQRHGVNAEVLRAIGWHESRLRPQAVGRNANGTVDIGAFQTNSIHLQALARHGLGAEQLQDGCVSADVGAWHYREQVRRHGNSWRAVGAYHSGTPARAAWYANAVARVLMGWQVLPPGPLPYPATATLAPNARIGAPAASPASARPAMQLRRAATPVVVYEAGNTLSHPTNSVALR